MRLSVLRVSAVATLCLFGASSQAQNWTGGGGTNTFNTPANWDTLPTNGSSLTFTQVNGNLVAPKFTLNNDFAALSITGITFNTDGTAFDYILNGNAITMTAGGGITNNTSSLQTINFNIASAVAQTANLSSGNLTIGGVISGAGGWTINGPGTLTLSAANTYTGATTISSGVLLLNNASAVASSTVSVNTTNGLTFASGIGTFNVAGLGTSSGSIALADTTGNQNVTLSVGSTNTTSAFTGSLTNGAGSGIGSLTKVGTGTFTLSGANSYTGITTVSAGTLEFGAEQSFYNGNSASWTASNFVVASGATLALSAGPFTGSDIQSISAQGTGTGGFLAGSTLGLDTAAGNFTDSNSIGNAGGNGLNISKLGANTLTLSGANTYTGTTTVNAGILQFALRSSFYSANTLNWTANNLIVNSGAVAAFNVGGAGEFTTTDIQNLSALGTATGGFRNGSSVGIDTSNVASGALVYSSVLANPNAGANAIGLTKLGNNNLSLTAANTFSGITAINGGTLLLGNSLALQNSTLNYNSQGGNLDLGTLTDFTLGGLAGAQGLTLQNDSSLPVNLTISNGLGAAYSGSLGGTNVTVTKNGAGTETFSGGNSFTGTTIVNAGTLTLSGAQSNTAFVVNGGTLALTTTAETTIQDFRVNGGTLSLGIGQGAQSTVELIGGSTLTTTQSLGAGNIIAALSGTSTFTTTALSTAATFNAVFGGNGNINASFSAGLNTMSTNMLSEFGGVFSFGSTNNFGRTVADTTAANFLAQYATVDLGTGTATISVRNGNDNVQLGALMGGANTTLSGGGNGGAAVYTVGSNNANTTFAGRITQGTTTSNLTKVGIGTLTLTDSSGTAFTGTGGVVVNGGTLEVDYTNAPTGVFAATNALNIGGGSLYLLGKNTGVTTQTLGNLTLTGAGGSSLIVDPNGGTSTTLTLGTLTATVNGGTLNILPPNVSIGAGTATITSTTDISAAGAIYSPRFTYGSDWMTGATAGVSTLAAYAGYNNLTTSIAGATVTTNDRLNDVGNAALTGAYTTNSLKITNSTPQSLALAGNALTLTSGGLLFNGSQAYSIGSAPNDGTLKSNTATNSDLILQQLGSGNLTINSTIVNGVGASVLTKAGFGTVTLAGNNTYTGVTNINGGVLSISSNGNLGAPATGANIDMNGGTLQATSSFTLDNAGANKRNVLIFGGGGTVDVTAGNNLNIDGVVSENNILQFGPLKKTGAGTLTLSGANTYGGATFVSGGVLSVNSLTDGAVIYASGGGKTTTNNSPTVSILNTTGITVGQSILGNGIPAGAIVSSVTPNTSITFTVNGVATNANASGAFPLTFYTPNSLGSSTSVANALVFDGGTLQYTGPTTSTNRTFTLTNNGGAIDGSGAGPVTFSATTPVVVDSALAGSGTRNLTLTGTTASNVFAGQLNNGTGGASSLTKASSGSWILTNPSHGYTGATTVTGGTLALGTPGSPGSLASTNPIASSSTINVATGGTLNVTGLTNSTLALGAQTLTGAGTVTGSVLSTAAGNLKPGTVTAGSAGTGTLSIGNLSLVSGTTLNFGLSAANLNGSLGAGADLISTGVLTLPSTGTANIELFQPNTNTPFLTAGTYDLVQFSSIVGNPVTSLAPGGITGNGAFSYSYGVSGNFLTVTLTQVAVAANWNVDSDGLWSVAGNWSGGLPGSHAGDSATFGNIITAPRTVTLDANETVGQIVFSPDNVAHPTASYTIANGGAFAITLNNNGSGASISDQSGSNAIGANLKLAEATTVSVANAADTLTISGNISTAAGTPSLTKTGAGTLILSDISNTYTGSTNINGGVLQFSALGSLGSGTAINFGGGTLKYASGNTADISTRTVTINVGGATVETNGNNVTFSNPIGNGGSGGFTKTGAGTLTFAPTALNTFTGPASVSGGTVNFSALGNFGAGTTINVSNGGTLQWATGTTTNISTRNVTIGAGGATFDANGNALSFTGAIGNSGAGALTLGSSAGGGSFTFGQASTYTGGTAINNVPVTLNDTATLGSGNITFQGTTGSITSNYAVGNRLTLPSINVAGGVTGSVTGSNRTTLTGLTGSGTINLVSTVLPTFNATTNISGISFTSNAGAGYSTFTGTINLSSSSAANNAAVLWYNGGAPANFDGNMSQATVNLTNNIRLSAITNSGGNTWTVGTLTGDSTAIIAGSDGGGTTPGLTVSTGGLNTNSTYAGTLVNGNVGGTGLGVLNLTKTGTGTLTLTNGASTYTGATTVNAGTLKLMNTSGSATGTGAVTVNSSGILAGTGFITGQSAATTVNVTVAAGGHIAPGDPDAVNRIGTLSIDSATLNAGALIDLDFKTGLKADGTTNNDVLNITNGGITFNGNASLNLFDGNVAVGAAFATPGTYDIIQYNPNNGTPSTSNLTIASPQANTLYSFGTASNVGTNQLSFVTLTITSNPVIFWSQNSDGQWGTDTSPGANNHWSTNTNPNMAGLQVAFDDTHTAFTAPRTVTLTGSPTVGSVNFNSAQSFTIVGNGNTLNIDNAILVGNISDTKGTHTISAPINFTGLGLNTSVTNAADKLTLSGSLSSSGPLNVTGAGTVALTADNSSYSGATTVSSGTLQLGHANALVNSQLTLSGGSLAFSPGVGTFHIPQINGTAAQTNIVLQDTATTPGPVNLALGNNGANWTYVGVLSGLGSLTKEGSGTLTLTGVNTFSGNITVSGGILAVNAGQLNGGNVTLNSGTTLTFNSGGGVGGTVTMNDTSTLRMAPTSNSVFPGNAIFVPAGANASITSAGLANVYNGLVTSGDSTSVLTVGTNVSFGGATDILANFTGTVHLDGGQLRWITTGATDGGLNTTFDLGGSGNMFDKNTATIDLGALVGGGGATLTATSGGANQTVLWSIGAKNLNTEFDGVISGSTANQFTSVAKVGTGTLTFGGVNTYAGTTTITKGTLALATQNAIATTSQVIFNGGTLNTGGLSHDFTNTANPATTINVTANSTLDLGSTISSPPEVVKFGNSSAIAWTAGSVLRISDWSGTPVTGNPSDADQLFIGSDSTGLSSTQALSQIHFTGFLTGANVLSTGEVVPNNTTALLRGDINQDHHVSVADISAMMAALSDLSDYRSGLTSIRSNNSIVFDTPDLLDVADVNGDGVVNNLDIQSLISFMASRNGVSTVSPVPEPSTFVLLGLGSLLLTARQYRRRGRRQTV